MNLYYVPLLFCLSKILFHSLLFIYHWKYLSILSWGCQGKEIYFWFFSVNFHNLYKKFYVIHSFFVKFPYFKCICICYIYSQWWHFVIILYYIRLMFWPVCCLGIMILCQWLINFLVTKLKNSHMNYYAM